MDLVEPINDEGPELVEENSFVGDINISSNLRRTIVGQASPYREDDDICTSEVVCSASLHQNSANSSVFKMHPLVRLMESSEEWTKHSDVACYHCCHPFDGPAVRIPHSITDVGIYCVRPTPFCSLFCAKAHLLESNPVDSIIQLTLLDRVARDVYGWTIPFIPSALPRQQLKMFGGEYSIDEFRAITSDGVNFPKLVCIREPPFTPLRIGSETSMIYQNDPAETSNVVTEPSTTTDQQNTGSWEVRNLRRPSKPTGLPRGSHQQEGESMIEKFASSHKSGQKWDASLHCQGKTVTSQTPSIQDVERAKNEPSSPVTLELSDALPPPPPKINKRSKKSSSNSGSEVENALARFMA